MTGAAGVGPGDLVGLLGGHPATAAGVDPAQEPGSWLVLACLLGGRADETRALRAFAALRGAGLASPAEIAKVGAPDVEARLSHAGLPKPDAAALRLWRTSRALVERHEGSPDSLARASEDLTDLAVRLLRLAPGVGRATVLRFLRPLRDHWPAAAEAPLAPSARAAAACLGWIREGEDEEGEPGALRAFLADAPGPGLCDVEAALERLGSRSCLRARVERCPLAAACPRTASD